MKRKYNIWILIVLIALISVGATFYYFYRTLDFDVSEDVYVYIDESKDYDKLLADVQTIGHVKNLFMFEEQVSFLNYKSVIKTGKYKISPKMTSLEFIRNLRAGIQSPHRITFNNIRLLNDLSESLSTQVMATKLELDAVLLDSSLVDSLGFDKNTFPAMFIPNTYEIYWDMPAKSIVLRLKKEYDKFWTEERKVKARKQKLTPLEVSSLAAIVEEECMFADEYPVVARLYLNRLNRGQLLQADPTVKYAVGDFGLRRILNKHLKTESPYNTYIHTGLPPGPIRIPSIKGINAVLNPADHRYLYMCAKEDFSGRHNFAVTLSEHNRNAGKYRRELNKRRIYQ